MEQALISIGSGGWWGKGYLQGTQSQLGFLRVQHTDFIFSVITEEMGLIFGSLIVLGIDGLYLVPHLRVASISPDPAGRYIAVGVATVLFFQTLVSVGMNLRLLAGHRAHPALRQLWGKLAHHPLHGCRRRSIRPHAPPQAGVWLNDRLFMILVRISVNHPSETVLPMIP